MKWKHVCRTDMPIFSLFNSGGKLVCLTRYGVLLHLPVSGLCPNPYITVVVWKMTLCFPINTGSNYTHTEHLWCLSRLFSHRIRAIYSTRNWQKRDIKLHCHVWKDTNSKQNLSPQAFIYLLLSVSRLLFCWAALDMDSDWWVYFSGKIDEKAGPEIKYNHLLLSLMLP